MSTRRNRQVQGQDTAARQAASTYAVPAAELLCRDAEIVSHALDRVSPMNFVAGDASRVGRGLVRGMLARSYWNHQLGVRLEFTAVKMIDFADRLDRCVIGACQ